MVSSYQPETSYEIFMRALFNKDIATGIDKLKDDYSSEGPSSTWEFKNNVPPAPEPICHTYSIALTSCTDEQRRWLQDGTAIVKNFVVIGREGPKVDSTQTAGPSDQIAMMEPEL